MTSGIYKIEHVASGKCYVGSAVNIHTRWTRHKWQLALGNHHSSKLQRAYAKYGDGSFRWVVIEPVSNKESLIEREQMWIDSLNAVSNGYNECPKAGSALGIKRSLETCKKIASAKLGKKHPPKTREQCLAQSLRQKGKKHKSHRSGWKFSDESRARMSAAFSGCKKSAEHIEKMAAAHRGLKHSVEQNAAQAARQTGVKRGPNKKIMVPRTEAYRAKLSVSITKYYERKRMALSQAFTQ